MLTESGKRMISGILLAAFVTVCIFAPPILVYAVVPSLSFFTLFELYCLYHLDKIYQGIGYFANFLALWFFWAKGGVSIYPIAGLLLLHLLAHLAKKFREPSYQGHTFQSAVISLGFLFISLPLIFAVALRKLPAGSWWLFFPVAAAAFCDTAAYAVGKWIGRRKLAPRISPGKTVEGTLAGISAAWLVTLWLGKFLQIPWIHRIILGGFLGLAAVLGDLTESAMKRKAGAKDSGNLIAGHGGILDRIDSHLLAVSAVFLYHALFIPS